MLLRTKFKRFQRETEDNFQGAAGDIIFLDTEHRRLAKEHNKLVADYSRLKNHISNNGLWGTVKQLVKRVEEMHMYQTNMANRIQELDTNGVATAINKLNEQVFGQSVEKGSTIERVLLAMNGIDARQEPSLAAKVDAIIAHLGIEVSVEPEKVVKTPAKIVAKKVKTTKKGRR